MVGRVKGTFWRWKIKENMIFFINLSEQILTFCHVLHKGPGAGSSHEMKRKKCKNRSKPFGTNHQNLLMWHGPGSSEQGHSRFYVKRQHTAKGAKAQVRLASPSEPGDNVLLRWAQLGSAPRWLEQWLAARGRHYSSLLSTSEWVWKGVLHITDIHNSGLLTQRGDKKRESTVIKHTRMHFPTNRTHPGPVPQKPAGEKASCPWGLPPPRPAGALLEAVAVPSADKKRSRSSSLFLSI